MQTNQNYFDKKYDFDIMTLLELKKELGNIFEKYGLDESYEDCKVRAFTLQQGDFTVKKSSDLAFQIFYKNSPLTIVTPYSRKWVEYVFYYIASNVELENLLKSGDIEAVRSYTKNDNNFPKFHKLQIDTIQRRIKERESIDSLTERQQELINDLLKQVEEKKTYIERLNKLKQLG
jgi:hypothetical protein